MSSKLDSIQHSGNGGSNLLYKYSKLYDTKVNEFLDSYTETEKQEQYKNLMKLTRERCEKLLDDIAIKGLVTGRIKNKDSLVKKLKDLKRKTTENTDTAAFNEPPNFRDFVIGGGDIYKHPDMGDLVGIRIGVYFPDDVSKVVKKIEEDFRRKFLFGTVTGGRHTSQGKNVDIQDHVNGPWYSLSGGLIEYWEHYGYKSWQVVVKLPNSPEGIDYPIAEIQVGTVATQAWAEIQHDIIYKRPPHIFATPTMKRMIDAINGLAITTDIMLKELERDLKDAEKEADQQPFENGAELLNWFEYTYLGRFNSHERQKWREAQNENLANMLIKSYESDRPMQLQTFSELVDVAHLEDFTTVLREVRPVDAETVDPKPPWHVFLTQVTQSVYEVEGYGIWLAIEENGLGDQGVYPKIRFDFILRYNIKRVRVQLVR
ncbi:hypothetical protein F5Y09DRAFT_347789 [Xylaria sp. FL1042]|nr:hypothetical protein F5Y09DRAFT_347789 [Xylaria sp. FL1042]